MTSPVYIAATQDKVNKMDDTTVTHVSVWSYMKRLYGTALTH
jgi:hypothetical protein